MIIQILNILNLLLDTLKTSIEPTKSDFYLGTRITVEGAEDVYNEFLRLANVFPTAINEMADRFMLAVEGQAKIEVPVVTGRLRDSIYSILKGFSGGSFVATNTDYAIFPHLKRPYMEIAFEMATLRDMDDLIDNVIDELGL